MGGENPTCFLSSGLLGRAFRSLCPGKDFRKTIMQPNARCRAELLLERVVPQWTGGTVPELTDDCRLR
jgi:hypothetical protein